MEYVLPDTGIFIGSLQKIKERDIDKVLVCKIVIEELDNYQYDQRVPQQIKIKAQKAISYIHEVKLIIIPDPELSTYKLFELDDQNSDDVILATYLQLIMTGKRNLVLHVSNDRASQKAKRTEKVFSDLLKGNLAKQVKEEPFTKKTVIHHSGKTGLAKTRTVKDKFNSDHIKGLKPTEIKSIALRIIGSLAVPIALFLLINSATKEEAVALDTKYLIEDLPFENIEIKLVSIENDDRTSILRYQMINRNPQPITFGVFNEKQPFEGYVPPKEHSIFVSEPSIRMVYKNNIIDFSNTSSLLEPNREANVVLLIDGPLERLVSVETFLKNETTGEVRNWRMNFDH